MPTIVTLQVYSGRSNPTWILPKGQERQLAERLESLGTFTNERPTGIIGGLGYRGFSVATIAESSVTLRAFFVHEGIVDQGSAAANLIDQAEIEAWLVTTAQGQLDDELRQFILSAVNARPRGRFSANLEAALACPPNNAIDAPAYNPGQWNVPTVQPYNNCYNYANNNATNTFAQPGRATGHPASVMACSHVSPAAISDGLRVVPNFNAPRTAGAGWYVALVVWPNRDYHWYRQDNVGCWSHKPGQTAVRNVDNSGLQIADPKTCDRGPYTDFCDYMLTDRNVRIR
jgi:hypothetical protein